MGESPILPDSGMTPYLPTMTRLGIREVEAGNRAQSDICCEMTLALMGSSHGETEPRKATYLRAGRNIKTLTTLELIPAAFFIR
jgi:hypothetical protein